MSTRAVIAYDHNGSFTATYLHFDGYPDHAGRILETMFADPNAALELASSPEIRSLDGSTVERFQDGRPAVKVTDLDEYAIQCGAEFTYVYHGGRWHVR